MKRIIISVIIALMLTTCTTYAKSQEDLRMFDFGIGEAWDAIIMYGIATEEELQLVTCLNGYSKEALNDVVYVRTGCRSIEQFIEG